MNKFFFFNNIPHMQINSIHKKIIAAIFKVQNNQSLNVHN